MSRGKKYFKALTRWSQREQRKALIGDKGPETVQIPPPVRIQPMVPGHTGRASRVRIRSLHDPRFSKARRRYNKARKLRRSRRRRLPHGRQVKPHARRVR